jgi:transcriptional regulator with XRE-family HTH domain
MVKKAKAPTITGPVLKKIREEIGINQEAFWGKLGLTQSAGSRYESGRNMSRTIKKLAYLIYMCGSADHRFDSI